jgi:hypothetical protein
VPIAHLPSPSNQLKQTSSPGRKSTNSLGAGSRLPINEPNLVPTEFVAGEKVNYSKDVSASEGVNTDDKTVKTSNLPLPPQEEEPSKVIQQTEDLKLTAIDNQAKLMR